jgi:phosphoserine aminotransferase
MGTWNFNAGPSALPAPVLHQVQSELRDYQGRGISVLEMSHRSDEFEAILQAAKADLRQLLSVPETHAIVFTTGGASGQFDTLPLQFLGEGQTADYVLTGSWGEKAAKAAEAFGKVARPFDDRTNGYRSVPSAIRFAEPVAYTHLTSNETIQGVQFPHDPLLAGPVFVDMSSDIASRPIDWSRVTLAYAGAQKNLGPAGVTIVIVRESDLPELARPVPVTLDLRNAIEHNSLYNTPPVFAVYMVGKVLRYWIEEGGIDVVLTRNQAKAAAIYAEIDASEGFYTGHADGAARSRMNVTFTLPDAEMTQRFLAEADRREMIGLGGHRSVGGIRASLYNAVPMAAATELAALMAEFRRQNA